MSTVLPRGVRATTRLAPLAIRWPTMASVGLRMMFHDRLKMLGTLFGVIFAVLLSNQQAGMYLSMVHKGVMFVENSDADIWVMPKGTETLQSGVALSISAMYAAQGVDGVAWAAPLLFGTATVQLPGGGMQAVTLIGTKGPRYAGGPWNMVQGTNHVLAEPDTMIFEDSERELLGGLNLGSVREVSGRRAVVGGFTWGLLPFGPSLAFADLEFARDLMHLSSDRVHYVLVGVRPGQDPEVVAERILAIQPGVMVMTKPRFQAMVLKYMFTKTAIGVMFGTGVVFALFIGFVIVSLAMFSSVLDNVREFGTLKAVGATLGDLAVLLATQAVTYALGGSVVGLALVTLMANAIRSPKMGIQMPWQLLVQTTGVMIAICVVASSLALLRLRKVEPAMVFR